jgi:hypothetical protein
MLKPLERKPFQIGDTVMVPREYRFAGVSHGTVVGAALDPKYIRVKISYGRLYSVVAVTSDQIYDALEAARKYQCERRQKAKAWRQNQRGVLT